MNRGQWRAIFEILREDEKRGIATTPDERRALAKMVETEGPIFWRCDQRGQPLPRNQYGCVLLRNELPLSVTFPSHNI